MMGQLSSGQERLFYSFNLEDHIPANHLLRSIDRCLDVSDLRHYLADFYSPIGRPSIDPELMIRMLIVGYCYGIRSERRLCEEAHLNLAYREWRAFKNERSHVTKANTIIFRSRQTDSVACPMKAKCCPNTSIRKIVRSVHEAARDVARRIAATPEYVRSRHERKKVEMLFAHLKRILKLDRLRLRGMSGATDEFTLAAAVQNLRRLAKLATQGPPSTG
ncbi:transposase [Pseudomonas neuropathica]|uniref:Transposase n=1 Tax=Pseudomonas neuropathica TaxID=2730425 RepID=A0ACC7MZM0_9PSED